MTHNQPRSTGGVVGFKPVSRPGSQSFRLLDASLPDLESSLVGGPNRDRIWDSAKYAYDRDVTMLVDLTADDGCVYRVQVTRVAHEDGSGHSLMFVGHVVAKLAESGHGHYPSSIGERKNVWVYLNTRTRQGRLRLSIRTQVL
jgi:hypothetical protein